MSEWSIELVTAPALEPVSIAEMKEHLRIDHADDDASIYAFTRAAREMAETITGRSLVTQTWRLFLDAYPPGSEIRLRRPPLQSVTHIKSYPETGSAVTFGSSNYTVDATGYRVVLSANGWPSTVLRSARGVEVQYVAGYGDNPGQVPESIRSWIKLRAAEMFENREASVVGAGVLATPLKFVDNLLSPYTVGYVG